MIVGIMDIIQYQDQFYILATSSRIDDRTRVLKHGETFAVFDRFGDMAPVGMGELGLYHEGTRFLSRLGLLLDQDRLLLLNSRVSDDNTVLSVDLTNPDVRSNGRLAISRGTIHVARGATRTAKVWRWCCAGRGTAASRLGGLLAAVAVPRQAQHTGVQPVCPIVRAEPVSDGHSACTGLRRLILITEVSAACQASSG